MNWSRRFSQLFTLRLRYQHTRLSTDAVPYFAGRTNVSGEAGIAGNDQDPENWGPPALRVRQRHCRVSATAAFTPPTHQAHGGGARCGVGPRTPLRHVRRRHAARRHFDSFGQQDARGVFSFTGSTTGSDFADFLLGLPHTSAIAFGNADKFLRGSVLRGYVNDDWRVSARR